MSGEITDHMSSSCGLLEISLLVYSFWTKAIKNTSFYSKESCAVDLVFLDQVHPLLSINTIYKMDLRSSLRANVIRDFGIQNCSLLTYKESLSSFISAHSENQL